MEKQELKRYLMIGVIAAAVCLIVMRFNMIIKAVAAVFAAASPLLLGCVIAYVLNILLKRLEKIYFPNSKSAAVKKSRRPVCIVLSFVLMTAILLLIAELVIPELISSIRLITDEIPGVVEDTIRWGIDHSGGIPALQESLSGIQMDWQSAAKNIMDFLVTGAGGVFNSMVSVISGVFGTITKAILGMIFAIYILASKETLKRQADRIMKAFLKPSVRKEIYYVADTFHKTFSSFIVGQCTEAVLIGTLCALGMFFLRMPYSVMTGVVVGVTALVPVVGAYIGAVVGAFMVFTVDPIQAVVFIVFLIILQQLEGNLIYPKVVGSSIGLPGLWVLGAVTVGGGIMGIGGMLIGVPLAASLYKLFSDEVERRLKRKDQSQQTFHKGK